ncbi:hypothetical protein RchiOBHm_Chr5g0076941 [Rosa chinensis]|uniref:Uncharacterized protein n=1 Tax=Rosa chinensis TaxID=74649 RepID=A0A2P6QLU5_ROSCH|nr:hypothetical protein RchiOBHm_Chr5g0076941 [Rosa chinensis]
MLKEKLNLMLLKKLKKILRVLSLGAPQTSSSLDSNEAMRTTKLAKLDTEVNFWMYFDRRGLLDALLLWIKDYLCTIHFGA